MKVCVVCNNSKPLSEFYKRKDSPDGYRNDCKLCRRSVSSKNYYTDQDLGKQKRREYYARLKAENPNLSAEIYARYRESSLEHSRLAYQANAEERKAKQRLWSKTNRGIANALSKRYRLKKAKATPLWLTPEQIYNMQCTYKVAAQLSETSSQKWHVDHIVPIRGKDVCGLHVPWNLQLLPAKMNMQKGNRI
jgi:post-segregation antitoxin (ccd killing protein)